MRHAFLIIAHGDFILLQKLILALECPEVDFYVHIDAKVKSIPALHVSGESALHILTDRVDTRWGDYSQIATELRLMDASFHKGSYSYYHIISGTHFPIKPIGKILSFYDRLDGKIVLSGLCQSTHYQEMMKLRHYNLFTRKLAYGTAGSRRIYQKLWWAAHGIQNFLKVRRNADITFYKASNWASFSEGAIEYLLNKKEYIRTVFKYSFCGDEYFAPTLLKASHLSDTIVSSDDLLKQEMGKANPRVYTMEDFDRLTGSGCLFARKFSDSRIDVVDRIAEYIKR